MLFLKSCFGGTGVLLPSWCTLVPTFKSDGKSCYFFPSETILYLRTRRILICKIIEQKRISSFSFLYQNTKICDIRQKWTIIIKNIHAYVHRTNKKIEHFILFRHKIVLRKYAKYSLSGNCVSSKVMWKRKIYRTVFKLKQTITFSLLVIICNFDSIYQFQRQFQP